MIDMIIRYVDGYGYLPIIKSDDKEIYRGEFQPNPNRAMERCLSAASSRGVFVKEYAPVSIFDSIA